MASSRTAVLTLALVASIVALATVASPVQADPDESLLIDFGNGSTEWTELGTGGSYGDAMGAALSSLGIDHDLDGDVEICGETSIEIGGTVTSWHLYVWEGGQWVDATDVIDLDSEYTGGSLALGFYPDGVVPVETPEHPSSWVMLRGDSANSGGQAADLSEAEGSVTWEYTYGNSNYVDATILVAGGYAYVVAGGGYTTNMADPTLYCYDRFTGEEVWSFVYGKGAGYETATGVIVGDHIYLPATNGTLYRIPLTGPGDDCSEVLELDIPKTTDHELTGMAYSTGPASLVYDSGVIYFGTSNGYVYCVDLDLNIVWKTAIGGRVYYNAPTVDGDVVYIGALDGCLYALDRYSGDILASTEVYTVTSGSSQSTFGSVNTPVVVDGLVMFSFSDGQGMNSMSGGIAAYRLTASGFEEVFRDTDIGLSSNTVLPVSDAGFSGVYFTNLDGLCRISTDGGFELLATGLGTFRGPITLVNGEYLFVNEYDRGGNTYMMDMDGNILASMSQPDLVSQFCMTPVVMIDGMLYISTDGGAYAWSGAMPVNSEVTPVSPSEEGAGGWMVAAAIVVAVILAMFAYLFHLSRREGMPLLPYIRSRIGDPERDGGRPRSKVARNKRRLALVLAIGSVIAVFVFLLSLSCGPSGNYSITETFSYLCSAIGKTLSGEALDFNETIIFDSRCSRAVAAFAAGVGLSIAGSVYQAIIRNPMVDPYIMGVSSGAGVAAVAAIAFDFTLFGLLDNVTYVTPIVAMVGGLVAFTFTMLLAEKSGGASINYVLAGVIVGLVFSAVQTLLLSMAGDELNDAMSWLFGSFSNIDWTETILMTVPALALSLVPLVWAKEFNLVLLGEDQAKQMGLDVRRFNRWMLILASVLASICVAFVGIIGFVGLVVPHLCRMILGGDHRLVMPASIVVGGALLMAADLFAKMVMVPLELPVGAITTIIGAPVFAYLLIRKGRMYDG